MGIRCSENHVEPRPGGLGQVAGSLVVVCVGAAWVGGAIASVWLLVSNYRYLTSAFLDLGGFWRFYALGSALTVSFLAAKLIATALKSVLSEPGEWPSVLIGSAAFVGVLLVGLVFSAAAWPLVWVFVFVWRRRSEEEEEERGEEEQLALSAEIAKAAGRRKRVRKPPAP